MPSANLQFSIFNSQFSISLFLFAIWLPASAIAKPPITAAAFAPDGRTVILGSQAGLELRDWPSLAPAGEIKTELSNVHDLAFSPAGEVLAVAGGEPGAAGVVELVRWPGGEWIRRINSHADVVHSIDWRPDGRSLATASADGGALVHDVDTGESLFRLAGHSRAVLAAVWLPDNHTLVTAAADQTIRIWDGSVVPSADKTIACERTLDNHTAAVQGLAVRPNQPAEGPPMIASIAADRTLRLWQPTIGRLVRFARLDSEPLSVAWTGNGALVAAACADGGLRIVDPDTAKIVKNRPGIDGWAYTLIAGPDGTFLVAGADGAAAVVMPDLVNSR